MRAYQSCSQRASGRSRIEEDPPRRPCALVLRYWSIACCITGAPPSDAGSDLRGVRVPVSPSIPQSNSATGAARKEVAVPLSLLVNKLEPSVLLELKIHRETPWTSG